MDTKDKQKLERLHSDVAEHLHQISALFTERPKITIVIRTPWLENGGGVLMSDDDFDLAIAEIQRLRKDDKSIIVTGERPGDRIAK